MMIEHKKRWYDVYLGDLGEGEDQGFWFEIVDNETDKRLIVRAPECFVPNFDPKLLEETSKTLIDKHMGEFE